MRATEKMYDVMLVQLSHCLWANMCIMPLLVLILPISKTSQKSKLIQVLKHCKNL